MQQNKTDNTTLTNLKEISLSNIQICLLRLAERCNQEKTSVIELLEPALAVVAAPAGNIQLLSDYSKSIKADSLTLSLQELERDFLYQFPNTTSWTESSTHNFNSVEFLFIADEQLILAGLERQAKLLQLPVEDRPCNDKVVLNDGCFSEDVAVSQVVAYGICAQISITEAISAVLKCASRHFQLFHQVFSTLNQTFAPISFSISQGQLSCVHNGKTHIIQPRQIVSAYEHAKLSLDDWTQRISLEDLFNLELSTSLSIRSPQYIQAFPEALYQQQHGFVLTAETLEGANLQAVHSTGHNAKNRMRHYVDEAKRYLGHFSRSAHTISAFQAPYAVIGLIGDGIADLAVHPSLVKKAINGCPHFHDSARVLADREDILFIATPNTPDSLLASAKEKAGRLYHSVYPEGCDAIRLDTHMPLPIQCRGQLNLSAVPEEFFSLLDVASAGKSNLEPGKMEYLCGLAYELIHAWQVATSWHKKALRLNITNPEYNFALGRTLMETQQQVEAIPFLEKAFFELPYNADLANTLGLAYYESGHADISIHAFEHAVYLRPNDVAYMNNLARAYLADQRFNEAERIVTSVLNQFPHNHEAQQLHSQAQERNGTKRNSTND